MKQYNNVNFMLHQLQLFLTYHTCVETFFNISTFDKTSYRTFSYNLQPMNHLQLSVFYTNMQYNVLHNNGCVM